MSDEPGVDELVGQLVVDHASKWFGDLVAVSDISFAVDAGVTQRCCGHQGADRPQSPKIDAVIPRERDRR